MWSVYNHQRVERQCQSLLLNILKCYEKWQDIVGLSGSDGLRRIRRFYDETLQASGKNIDHRILPHVLRRNIEFIYQVNIHGQ